MKRTHPSTVIAFIGGGVVLGYLMDLAIVAAGRHALVPPISLPITLLIIGAVVAALAWPIRRAVTGASKRRIEPFRAMRIAVLAKACSVSGALVLGMGLGILVFLLTRTVVSTGDVWLAVGTAAGAAALTAGGLLAEWFCTLPPPEDPDQEEHAHA
ncbi:DUF3180 domain-containing protein [Agromyces archimandritae]|uniref:DUF3180 domain-containing protein n=1 Tax=Agromyces archimandritae TaxID=2781962 RepID=A0A975FPR9_9MICO|nr:DUF3180 domain-containing protein [Agromyces archimandritae]QTX05567.1 DUF3180 domain-containing protein [Agromyces archimandritae]